jgi:hypothetical protein
LIVDQVLDILALPAERIVPPSHVLPEGLGEALALQGLASTSYGLALLIDPRHLFSPDYQQLLAQVAELLSDLAIQTGTEAVRAWPPSCRAAAQMALPWATATICVSAGW